MILPILTYPDPRLREIAKPITDFTPELKKLSEDMLETMYGENGIGLAATQVNEQRRMLVIDCRPRGQGSRFDNEEEDTRTELEKAVTQPLVICNPVIVRGEGKTTFDEGCLSVPSFFETVERQKWIELSYQDVHGQKKTLQTDGLLAIVIQHEMDHLEGTLFIDHLSLVKANKIKNEIKKHGYPEKKPRNSGDDDLDEKEL